MAGSSLELIKIIFFKLNTAQPPGTVTMETQDTYHEVKGGWVGWEKSSIRTVQQQKTHTDLTSKAKL